MSKVVDLELIRKERSNDARDWSVLDALKQAIENIETGKWKPTSGIVALVEESAEGQELIWNAAGCNRFELLGLLSTYSTYLAQCDD
jgi:hypothetical protein